MWLSLSLFYALNSSLLLTLTKRLSLRLHPLSLLFLNILFSLPIMFGIIYFSQGIPKVSQMFFIFMIFASLLDLVAFISSTWAIKHSPISLLSPLSSFTPVFATLFGALILHEIPTPTKLLGILIIVMGAYMLHISHVKTGILEPIKKLYFNKGVRLYFLTMVIFGLTPVFQKQAIFQTDPTTPIFASFVGNTLVVFYLSFFALRKVKEEKKVVVNYFPFFVLYGILNTLGQFAAYTVFSTSYVGYATAIFSLTSLFSVVLGFLFFKETDIRDRLIGALTMVAGTILIAL